MTPRAGGAKPPQDPATALRRQPRQSRGEQRVARLLDAAAEVIAEHGLDAATAEAIARHARTAKGSLYQFFPNRDAVVAALALRYADELHHIHERAFATDPRSLPLEKLIDRIVRPLATFHDRNPAFRRVFGMVDGSRDGAAGTAGTPHRMRAQLFEQFVDRLDVLFAARNPQLAARERRRAAVVAATIGQGILARRAKAPTAERSFLLRELRVVLVGYLSVAVDQHDG